MRLPAIVNKIIISCCLLFATSASVLAQKVIKVDSSQTMTLRIDPSNATGGNVSDIFTDVNYIPLETTDESLFGSITKLEITDDYYIILDNNTHCILIFTKAGKFHAKIKSSEGKSMIYSFSINKWSKQIIFSRDNYKNMTFCDYDGKVIKTTPLGGETAKDESNSDEFYYFAPDKGVTSQYSSDLDSTSKYYKTFSKSLIIYADTKHKVYAQGLPFKKQEGKLELFYMGGISPELTNAGVDTVFFYSKPYSYSLYTVTPGAIKFSYKIVFPLYASIPADFSSNPIYNEKRFEYIQKHPTLIFRISNVYQPGNNLVFKAGVWGATKEDHLIYNVKSGSLIAYQHILPDAKSFFLPISEDSWNYSGIAACKDGYIYTSLSSLAMFKADEENKDNKDIKNAGYTPALAQYFKKGSRKDNPCILQLKLKNDL
jgi:hypothetical protein